MCGAWLPSLMFISGFAAGSAWCWLLGERRRKELSGIVELLRRRGIEVESPEAASGQAGPGGGGTEEGEERIVFNRAHRRRVLEKRRDDFRRAMGVCGLPECDQ